MFFGALRTLRYENNITFVTHVIYTNCKYKTAKRFSLKKRPNRRETLNWRRRAKHRSTQVPPLFAVDGDDGDSRVVPPFSTVPLQFHFSLISEHQNTPVPLSLIFLQLRRNLSLYNCNAPKIKNSTTLQLTRNSSSISLQLTRTHTTSEHLSSSMLAKIYCETC